MKVFIIAAITVDGFIGKTADHLANWTGKADKRLFVQLSKEAGVVVMGSRTFATFGRALPERRNIVYTSRPESITAEGVETTSEAPQELIARLKAEKAAGLAVIGGASIYQQFLSAGVVDELYITVVPIVFGQGISLLARAVEARLALLGQRDLGDGSVLLHYKVLVGQQKYFA